MSKYKLIASDLDGTLLNDGMEYTAANAAAIKEISDRGVIFVATSGRTFYEIPKSIRDDANIRYVTYSNGTAVFDKKRNCDIISHRITKEDANKAFDILKDYDVLYTLHINGYSNMDITNTKDSDFKHYQINDYYKTLLLRSVMVDGIEKTGRETDGLEAVVIFFHSDEEMVKCSERLSGIPGITVTSSIGHNIELCSSSAGKGTALKELSDLLGISTEDVIAVGDNINDTSMFAVCGLSLCTQNGNKNAKLSADEVICSNNEHIAEFILKKYIGE